MTTPPTGGNAPLPHHVRVWQDRTRSVSGGRVGIRMGQTCAVHKHRELVPLETHHIWPLGIGGPDAEWNKIVVCENGHGSIHSYLDMLIKRGWSGLSIDWSVRRRYGRKVRALAQKGYDAYLASRA